ncbi:hypothetical protein HF877_06185 [Rhodococcus sp. BL-253-APC-6A1W]|uniref:hypothetical protein n=1 Tax=Rhodococcus sp. BL-253-APC-6A1W TaxID=2725307 RepID=UPI00146A27E7|nr:hypothetical protein [Rhodococcus sp. BL-253-APC-6A1W]NMD94992.1 hypothetical protein [Rhodococcus sp. BL-253-APC-6A1W]
MEGLRQLARAVGILRWTEPPEVGFWDSVFNGLPERSYTGCLPVAYQRMPGDTDSVIIEWELLGPRAHPAVLSSVADQMLTSLRINRVLKTERVDRSARIIQILTNDRVIHYPAEEILDPPIPDSPIELRSYRVPRPAILAPAETGRQWRVTVSQVQEAQRG